MRPYRGITYPEILSYDWTLAIWRRFFCKHDIHLFDEVFTSDWYSDDEQEKREGHYLDCDACGLIVYIAGIDEQYMKGQK